MRMRILVETASESRSVSVSAAGTGFAGMTNRALGIFGQDLGEDQDLTISRT